MTKATPVPGRRSTRQRAAVVELLDDIDDFRSAQELYDELRRRGDAIGLTTVYRTLQSLSDAGLVDTMRTESGEVIYRRCSDHHHHHLVCRECGYTVEVEGPAVERWAESIAASNGFVNLRHTVEIVGTCADCNAARSCPFSTHRDPPAPVRDGGGQRQSRARGPASRHEAAGTDRPLGPAGRPATCATAARPPRAARARGSRLPRS